jgi:hypothetical protein
MTLAVMRVQVARLEQECRHSVASPR